MSHSVRVSIVLIIAMAAANGQTNLRQPLITRPIDDAALVTLRGNTHPLAQRQYDMGVAPPDLQLNRMLLVLKRSPQQDFALTRLLDDQQDRNSPSYHRWMTPSQFGTQFGPTDQDLQLITGWLQSHGFQVNRVSNGRTVIEFSGFESQLEAAFHTQIHRYALPNGEQHWANATDPQIPAALLPAVAGVWSMHDFRKQPKIRISNQRIPIPTKGASPLLTYQGRHALMPGDFATIYNLNPLYSAGTNGQGATIAVVGRSDFNWNDVSSFRSIAALPFAPLNLIIDGADPGIFDPNEEFEADLDATWSGAVATNATVNFVASASTNTSDGVDLSEVYIIDNNLGDVMTESFGSCEGFASQAEAQALSSLAQQAAAEGITYMVSSGDAGAEGCVYPGNSSAGGAQPSVNVLASPPYIVAVGGTMFNDSSNASTYWNSNNSAVNLSSAKSYIPENVWNESCANSCGLWSGGGGVSTFFTKPNWQSGVAGIPNDGARDLPDVSLTAAGGHDPYLLCFENSCSQGGLYGVGGTSASAPSFAGIMALVVQSYGRQGLANYLLYRLAASETLSQCNGSSTSALPNAACIFNDVTVGNNAVPGELNYGNSSALYQAKTGYDPASGLGSVNAYNLVTKWNTVTFNATATTLGPASISGTHGSPVSLNISVAPSSGSGTPTGDVSLQTGLSNAANPGFLTLANGAANAPVNNLPGGSYTLTARYAGDSTYAPSTSNGVQVNISPENSTTTVSMFTAAPNGAPIPFTSGSYGGFVYPRADVAGVSGNGVPTGYVYFLDNGLYIGSNLSLNSAGTAALPNGYPWFAAGQHSLTASYQGDSSFNQSTSAPVTFTITPATTNLAISASPSSAAAGSSVTLTATLTSSAFAGQPSANFPSGSVTFLNGSTQVGTAFLYNNGQSQNGLTSIATLMTSSLPNGANSITAQYAGDTNYSGSSSSTITVSVSADFSIAPNSTSVAVAQGGSGTDMLTITGQTGYNNTVDFTSASCTGLPLKSSCGFSAPSVTGSGSVTVTFSTTAPTYAALERTELTAVGFLFVGLLLMGVPSRRIRSSAALSVVLAVITLGSVACGGGGSTTTTHTPGTPKGSYPVVITAMTTDRAITHTVNITLTVQ